MDYEMIGGTHELLPNLTVQKIMYDNLVKVGGVTYTNEEKAFAEKISKTLGKGAPDISTAQIVQPYKETAQAYGSTDVGDVSYTVPTAGLGTVTWVPGTPAHSWQAVAAGGMSIGSKGMMVAAKTLALTAMDIFESPKQSKLPKKNWKKDVARTLNMFPCWATDHLHWITVNKFLPNHCNKSCFIDTNR